MKDWIFDPLVVAGLFIAAFLVLLFGYTLGTDYDADHCRDFGSFKNSGKFYDCTPRVRP